MRWGFGQSRNRWGDSSTNEEEDYKTWRQRKQLEFEERQSARERESLGRQAGKRMRKDDFYAGVPVTQTPKAIIQSEWDDVVERARQRRENMIERKRQELSNQMYSHRNQSLDIGNRINDSMIRDVLGRYEQELKEEEEYNLQQLWQNMQSKYNMPGEDMWG
jgi:hypothetical protein